MIHISECCPSCFFVPGPGSGLVSRGSSAYEILLNKFLGEDILFEQMEILIVKLAVLYKFQRVLKKILSVHLCLGY